MTKNEIADIFRKELESKASAAKDIATRIRGLSERDLRYDNYHHLLEGLMMTKTEMYAIREFADAFDLDVEIGDDFSVSVEARDEPCQYSHNEVLDHKDEIIQAALKNFKKEGSRTERDGHKGFWMDVTDWTDDAEYRQLLDLEKNQLCTYVKQAGSRKFVLDREESLDDPYALEVLQYQTY